MKVLSISFLLSLLLIAGCTPANLGYSDAMERNNRRLENEQERQDAEFLVEAADYNLLLRGISEQAASRGYARMITDFATQNQSEHRVMGERLRSLGKNKNFALPAEISDRNIGMLRDIEDAQPQDIDRIYLNSIEILHERMLRLYENAALNASDAEVRSYAAAQLDIIRSHMRQAETMRQELI